MEKGEREKKTELDKNYMIFMLLSTENDGGTGDHNSSIKNHKNREMNVCSQNYGNFIYPKDT